MRAKYLRGAVWQLEVVQELREVTHFTFKAMGSRERLTIVLHRNQPNQHVELLRRHQPMSLKPERREHLRSVALQMQAITALTPEMETPVYPPVKIL